MIEKYKIWIWSIQIDFIAIFWFERFHTIYTSFKTFIWRKLSSSWRPEVFTKVRCVFAMVMTSEFYMGQYRDDDHPVAAAHFNNHFRSLVFEPEVRVSTIFKITIENLVSCSTT